jgi:hypothetical protein
MIREPHANRVTGLLPGLFAWIERRQVKAPKWKPDARPFVLFAVFFGICFGLGYSILNRYDPRERPGTIDVGEYAAVVNPAERAAGLDIVQHRILVPWVAKPFFRIAQGRIGTWDPVLFGLLISTSLFTAGSALLLYRFVILHFGKELEAEALIAALLFLTNFAVPNYFLTGLIDSGEAFFGLVLLHVLSAGRYSFLPLVTAAGSLAKETFLPLSALFMLAWWWFGSQGKRGKHFGWIVVAIVSAAVTVVAALSIQEGSLRTPFDFARTLREDNVPGSSWSYFASILKSHGVMFVFGWLLPIGIWRIRRLPKPWIAAVALTVLSILALGTYDNSGSNVDRALFSFAGPLLCVSAALFLTTSRAAWRPNHSE